MRNYCDLGEKYGRLCVVRGFLAKQNRRAIARRLLSDISPLLTI